MNDVNLNSNITIWFSSISKTINYTCLHFPGVTRNRMQISNGVRHRPISTPLIIEFWIWILKFSFVKLESDTETLPVDLQFHHHPSCWSKEVLWLMLTINKSPMFILKTVSSLLLIQLSLYYFSNESFLTCNYLLQDTYHVKMNTILKKWK